MLSFADEVLLMRQMNRVLFFLLLNIIISACTTLAVLVAYDQFRAPLPGGLIAPLLSSSLRPERPTSTPSQEATAQPAVTPTPAAQIHAVVDGETFESIAQLYHVTRV